MDRALLRLFADADLQKHHASAKRWCDEARISTVEELFHRFDDLLAVLRLPALEAKRCKEALEVACGISRSYSAPVKLDAGALERVLSDDVVLADMKTVSVGYNASAAIYRDGIAARTNSPSRLSRAHSEDTQLGRSSSLCSEIQPLRRAEDTVGGAGVSSREVLRSQASDKELVPVDEGQTGSVYALEAEDGRKLAIFKPKIGEGFERHGIPTGKGAIREEAVYIVDRLCEQWAHVPVTTQTSVEVAGKRLEGALQQFHEDVTDFAEDVGMPSGFDNAIAKVRQEDAEGVALLDMRVCNTDRHGSNLLLLGQAWPKALGPIDHGCCLPPWWALDEAVFDAWRAWPQLQCRPSSAARARAQMANAQLPKVCAELAKLGLDRHSILTLQICTSLVAVGVGTFGLPIASVAGLMVREDFSELCWLEEQVLEAARLADAKVSVQRNKRDDKVLVFEEKKSSDLEAFASRIVERLETVFRAELPKACGQEAIPDFERTSGGTKRAEEEDDEDDSPLQRSGATLGSSQASQQKLLHGEGENCDDDEDDEDAVLQRANAASN